MNPLQSKGGRPKNQPNLNQIVEKSYEYPRIQRGEAYESTEPKPNPTKNRMHTLQSKGGRP